MKNPGRVEDTTGDHGSSVPLMSAQGDDFDDQVLILLKNTCMKERLQRVNITTNEEEKQMEVCWYITLMLVQQRQFSQRAEDYLEKR